MVWSSSPESIASIISWPKLYDYIKKEEMVSGGMGKATRVVNKSSRKRTLPADLQEGYPSWETVQFHSVGDAIQPSHPLLSPSPPAFNLSQHQDLF